MKKIVFFFLLLGVIGLSSVATFAQCDRGRLSPIQCGFYDEGYEDGTNDANSNRGSDYRRYRNKLDSQLYERYYIQGYDAGYVSVRPTNPYPGNGNGNGRPGRGTPTGTVDWSGRVDNRVNIVIRGGEVSNQIVAGRFNNGYQNINGVLPRRNATVSVSKLAGRGTAFVFQQPSRSNDFTALVQVSDPEKSDDDYRLQIRWQTNGGGGNSGAEENYSTGRVVWRGRVDQKVNITISGSYVDTTDASGTGLSGVDYNINGYLAARNGNVTVKKRRGRGSVTVLQQPSDYNNYEAIIQVFDPDGGNDDYEVEINW